MCVILGPALCSLNMHRMCLVVQGHKEEVTHVTFSRDSLWVATCSTDCTARLWSVQSSQLQGFFMADSSLTHCVFAGPPQQQDTLLVSGDNGSIHFLQL